MPKFHIGKRGNTAACHAKGKCPLGGDESHGKTREEVQTIIDSYYETEAALRRHQELPESTNAFETAGRLKAYKEKQEYLVQLINGIEERNRSIFYSSYGTAEQIEAAIASNPERIANEKAYLANREMVLADRDAYKEKALAEIQENNPFGERLTISKAGKLFVKDIQKDEWPAYNNIKDKLKEINEEEQKYIDASYAYAPKDRPFTDNEIKEMQADLEKLKEQPERIDTTKHREEYEKVSAEIKRYEQLHKEQLFEERTGHKLSELKPVRNEVSDEVRVDEKGNFTNVYVKDNGVTYKVLKTGYEPDSYGGIGRSYLEVETLNGDKKELSMTTTWNWRMRSTHDAYNSLPNVYTVEDDKGTLTKEPVKFTKIMIDSSD
jgi:hypothetical protein